MPEQIRSEWLSSSDRALSTEQTLWHLNLLIALDKVCDSINLPHDSLKTYCLFVSHLTTARFIPAPRESLGQSSESTNSPLPEDGFRNLKISPVGASGTLSPFPQLFNLKNFKFTDNWKNCIHTYTLPGFTQYYHFPTPAFMSLFLHCGLMNFFSTFYHVSISFHFDTQTVPDLDWASEEPSHWLHTSFFEDFFAFLWSLPPIFQVHLYFLFLSLRTSHFSMDLGSF